MAVAVLASGQDGISHYRYWLDNSKQEGAVNGNTDGNMSLDIDIDALTDGAHLLSVMVADNNGNWSAPARRLFVKPHFPAAVEQGSIARYRYWLDNSKQEGAVNGNTDGVLSLDIDIDALTDGAHLLSVMVADNHGNWTAPARRLFVKPHFPAAVEQGSIARYRYWLDNNKQEGAVNGNTDGVLSLDIDIDALADGAHLLSVMVADNHGNWTAPARRLFVKMSQVEQPVQHHIAHCMYWFDADRSTAVIAEAADGLLTLDIDVESLSSGAHMIDIMMADDAGNWTPAARRHFVLIRTEEVIPEHQLSLVGYDYWFNHGAHRRVLLDEPSRELILVDVDIEVDDSVLPNQITTGNYTFERETGMVYVPDNVVFGVAPVDNNGTVGEARTETFEAVLPVNTGMVLLKHKQEYDFDVPPYYGGIRGFKVDSITAGANVSFTLNAVGATVDLFDNAGERINATRTVEEGIVTYRMRPVAGNAYALVHSVTEPVVDLTAMWRVVQQGDLNDDGRVNVGDVNVALNDIIVTGGQTIDYDVNGDGQVNVGDVNAILNIIIDNAAKARARLARQAM